MNICECRKLPVREMLFCFYPIVRFDGTMSFPPKTVSLFLLLSFILILAPPAFAEGGAPDLPAAKGPSVKPAEHSDPEGRLIY